MSQASHHRVGQYNFLRKLGAGRIAEVYLGRIDGAEGFQKPVAIKKIFPQLAADPAFVQSLIAEAKIGGQLHHRNIVEVYDFIRYEDEYCIIMEYVEGVDLSRVLRAARQYRIRIPPAASLYIISQICDGLEYAHTARGFNGEPLHIIHRDLKPSNILISTKGGVKISDFGVARVVEQALQKTGTLGTGSASLQYQSPEQATGGMRLTAASDIFSVGAVFYELLTLEPLFPSKNVLETLERLRDADLAKRLALAQKALPGSEKILAAALHPNPARRYKSAAAMGEDIRRLLAYLRVDDPRERLSSFFWRLVRFIREKSKEGGGGDLLGGGEAPARSPTAAPARGAPAAVQPAPEDILDPHDAGEFGPYDEEGRPSWGDDESEAGPPSHTAGQELRPEPPAAAPAGALYEDEEPAYVPPPAFVPPPAAPTPAPVDDDPWGGVSTRMVSTSFDEDDGPSPDSTVARPYEPPASPAARLAAVESPSDHHELTAVRPPTHIDIPVSAPPPDYLQHDADRTYLRPSDVGTSSWNVASGEGTAPVATGYAASEGTGEVPDVGAEPSEEAAPPRSRSVMRAVVAATVFIAVGAAVAVGVAYLRDRPEAAPEPPAIVVAPKAPDPVPAVDPAPAPDVAVVDPAAATPKPEVAVVDPASTGSSTTGSTGSASTGSTGSATTGSPASGSSYTGSSGSNTSSRPSTGGSTTSSSSTTGTSSRPTTASTSVAPIAVYTPPPSRPSTQPVAAVKPPPTTKPAPTPVPAPPSNTTVASLPPSAGRSAEDLLKDMFADSAATTAVAQKGKLAPDQIGALASVGKENEERFTASRTFLVLHYKASGNNAEYARTLEELMSLPTNQYNPTLRLEQAEYYLATEKFSQAIESAGIAERYRQKFPAGDVYYVRLARTYEVMANAYYGRFRTSEDPDDLEQSINMWQRYLTHVEKKQDEKRMKLARDNIAKLEKIKERM